MVLLQNRRAAHFAHFSEENAQEDDNVHAGGNTARTLGPWSSAVELVNARQAAAEQRNNKLLAATRQQVLDVEWTPSRDPQLGPRAACPVPALYDMAQHLLVRHIDAVTSLWGVPDSIRSRLAAAVCAQRKLSSEVAHLFGSDRPTELTLPDCTQLDPTAMLQLLGLLITGEGTVDPVAAEGGGLAGPGKAEKQQQPQQQPKQQQQLQQCRLERLELGHCGRGFTDGAAAALAAAGPFQHLTVLRLGGAYKLTDQGILKVLEAAPMLKELAVPSASRLTGACLDRLPAVAPQLCSLDLSNCRGLPGSALASVLGQLVNLNRLVLDGVPEVDAAVLTAAGRCPSLKALSLAMCPQVNDAGLTALAAVGRAGSTRAHSGLEELGLDECSYVTDQGLLAVTHVCKRLRVLSLKRCARLTDEAIAAVADKGTLEVLSVNAVHNIGLATIQALASSCKETLQELDISFCRGVPEGALGQLVDKCERLERLKLYGCSQLTKRFLHGHSNEGLVEVAGVNTSCL
eukprot:GHRR01028028.1.p1 GENE.GHRR01028028.1~~GHRR01028028.1.p1  ORF type:complete len:517 (+),score=163.65 GHRR01028028.1:303-1853(+)